MASSSDKTVNALDLSTELTEEQLLIVADPKTGRMYQAPMAKLKEFIGVVSGANGKSAYQLAVDAGFAGTMEQWLNSLKGEKGDEGTGAAQTEPQRRATVPFDSFLYDSAAPDKDYPDPLTGNFFCLIERTKVGDKGNISLINNGGFSILFNAVQTQQNYPVGLIKLFYEHKQDAGNGEPGLTITCLNPA